MINILHETDTAYFVDKPSGLLVHNSFYAGPKERSLRMALGEQVGRRVFPVHRLDRPTSGVMVFAKETEHVAAWQLALSADVARKLYLGIVTDRVDASPRLIDHHVKVGDGEKKDAQTEILGGEVGADDRCTLLAFSLHTGRKHQIRQHMKHLRHPLLEDTTYGKGRFNQPFRDEFGLDRLALHAHSLRIHSPDDDALIEVKSPVPPALASVFDSLFDGGLLAAVDRILPAGA